MDFDSGLYHGLLNFRDPISPGAPSEDSETADGASPT